MAKRFYGNGFVCSANAARSFFSARIATADSATVASTAAIEPGDVSGAPPIVDTGKVRKDASIIATVNGNTANAGHKRA